MSSDESPNVPAERDRRHAVREKAQQVQAQQSRARVIRTHLDRDRDRRRRGHRRRRGDLGGHLRGIPAPPQPGERHRRRLRRHDRRGRRFGGRSGTVDDEAAAQSLEAVPAETPTATPTPTPAATDQPVVDIRVYVDYLSTGSHDFQVANVQQLSKWVTEDAATLTYYPVAMLTAKSNGTKYSLRAASAAACVATHSPDTFFAFNNALLAEQPDGRLRRLHRRRARRHGDRLGCRTRRRSCARASRSRRSPRGRSPRPSARCRACPTPRTSRSPARRWCSSTACRTSARWMTPRSSRSSC